MIKSLLDWLISRLDNLTITSNSLDGRVSEIENEYVEYIGLITQASTNAPTEVIVKNELGGEIVWAYSSEGVFTATLAEAFTADKTVVLLNNNSVEATRTSADVITLTGASNGLLNASELIIKVYS